MENDWIVFFLASSIMALGIGLDAAIATFIRYPNLTTSSQKYYWVVGVSATHTLFPMLGYLLAYFSIQLFPYLTPLIGLLAFILVFHYLYEEIFQEGSNEEMRTWITMGLILAVSWDALWSGPAKSAQVVNWSQWMIWLSFIWVGVLVSILCMLSGYLSKRLINKESLDDRILDFLQWLQFSVIAYFGLLAFIRYTMQWQLSEIIIFFLSGICVIGLNKMKGILRKQPLQA